MEASLKQIIEIKQRQTKIKKAIKRKLEI